MGLREGRKVAIVEEVDEKLALMARGSAGSPFLLARTWALREAEGEKERDREGRRERREGERGLRL